jgi:hypothetical protein
MSLIRIYTYVRSRTRTYVVVHVLYFTSFMSIFFSRRQWLMSFEFFILIIDNYASITEYCYKITLNLLDQKKHSYMLRCLQATRPYFCL